MPDFRGLACRRSRDAARQVTKIGVWGAAGLERGHLLERLYRDVRAPRIYEGTSEIQREVIARQLYRGRPE